MVYLSQHQQLNKQEEDFEHPRASLHECPTDHPLASCIPSTPAAGPALINGLEEEYDDLPGLIMLQMTRMRMTITDERS